MPKNPLIPEDFDRNNFETPDWFFRRLDEEFHFTYDLAATEKNRKCEKYIGTAENSLGQYWHRLSNGFMFLNPPYKPLRPWILKAQQEARWGAKLVLVVPPWVQNRTYFHQYRPDEIRTIIGRISFCINGVEIDGNRDDTCILVYDNARRNPRVTWITRESIAPAKVPVPNLSEIRSEGRKRPLNEQPKLENAL